MKVYSNATFITCEPASECYSAMAVDGGKIIWIGDDVPGQFLTAERVDLGGACVTPAFADTHMHFESFCLFENTFYLCDVTDFSEAKQIVSNFSADHPKSAVLLGFGCSAHTVREGRLPERADLDDWTDRPLIIVKYDGHAAVGNSALMDLLSDKVKQDPGCKLETGWLYQNAFYNGVNEVTAKVPSLDIVKGLAKGADTLARAGIGFVHTVEGVGFKNDLDVDTINMLAPALPQAFRIFFQTMDLEKVAKRKMKRVGGCFKLALDGCFGSEDAALKEPYTNDSSNYGMLYYTQEEVNAFAIAANRAGMQITMHAIGDAAVEQCITAYEAAIADTPRKDHRHVMIHACLISGEQLDRVKKLGLSLAVQSPFIYWDQEPQSYLESILGERTNRLNPLKSMLDRGIVMGNGSDAPTTKPNPIIGMAFAVNHPNPEERIEPIDALRMITYNPAYMTFDEDKRGSLTAGKIADFVVLDKNPLEVPREEIGDIKVQALYLAGEKYKTRMKGAMGLFLSSLGNKMFKREYL